jgi:multidrug transporter EmrE-like cation transporter
MSTFDLSMLSIAEIFGDFKFKDYARLGGWENFTQGLVGYAGVIFFLIRSLRVGNVIYVNGMWDGISAILETIAAFVILGERMNTTWQYVGLGLLIVGLFLVRMGGIAKD